MNRHIKIPMTETRIMRLDKVQKLHGKSIVSILVQGLKNLDAKRGVSAAGFEEPQCT